MVLQKLRSKFREKVAEYLIPGVSFVVLFALLLIINTTAFNNGYIYDELLMVGEKALLVYKGDPPRLENLGFVYPPLIYPFVLVFRNPLIASAFVGALCASALLFNAAKARNLKRIPSSAFVAMIAFIIGSPASLFLLAEHQSLCLFSAVFLQLSYHLYRYCRFHYTLDLLLFGMMTAILFFIRFQAVAIIPLLVIPFLFARTEISLPEKLSIIIIAFFPSLFFLASWSYLNWIFMKDPFYFFRTWLSAMELSSSYEATSGSMAGILHYCLGRLKSLFPFILPVFISILRQIKMGYKQCKVTPSILASPFVLMAVDGMVGVTHEHSMAYSVIFIVAAISLRMYFPVEETSRFLRGLFTASILASAIAGWIFLDKHPEEKNFIASLVKPTDHTTLAYARALVHNIDRNGTILMDDTRGFPVVFVEGTPRRFVLPYQYGYETVLSAPYHFVRYVIVSSYAGDRVAGRWQGAYYGELQGFKFLGRYGNFILYEKTPVRAASAAP